MRFVAVMSRIAPAVLSLSTVAAAALLLSGSASAQILIGPTGPGGGGGHRDGDFEVYDPCAYNDCYRRPPRRFRPGPNVIIVPDDGPYPYVYEEDAGREPYIRKVKPQAKPKARAKQEKPKLDAPKTAAASGLVAGRDYRADEVLVEIPLSVPDAEIDALARQQRIEKLGSQHLSLLDTRLHRWRITDGRTPAAVAAALRADARVSGASLNQIFTLQEAAPAAGPPQYAAEKLKLSEAHAITHGETALVALIDSGADGAHPELEGVIADSFDAIGGTLKPHTHGTGMAGAIAAHGQIQGVAPKARILNVRAFAPNGKTNDGTTFDVVRGMDWAAEQKARVFNLSFAGPRDPLLSRVVKAALDKGIVVIAASGNAGPNSPPLYPGADSGVIAVTATDSNDGLMAMANRGGYVTLAAPGVDILLPAPDKAYAVSSGTSIATAYVSGTAALMIARHPEANAKEIYEVLTGTARDLGAKGRDKEFGAGLADPLAALEAMEPVTQTVSAPAAQPPR